MKIVTFVKHVPSSAVTPRIAAAGDCIEEAGLAYEVNETDLYAIEEALYQRSVHQGSVVAVTVGPGRAKEALHVAYAKGVDHAVHVVDEAPRGGDSSQSVAAAAEVAKKMGYDAIFTGIQADDDLSGRFGVALAEALGIPVVSAVVEIKISPKERVATVVRELGGHFKEEIEVDLPCVFTIQFGIRPARYTSIMSIVKARSRKIESIGVETLDLSKDQPSRGRLRVLGLSYPEDGGRCEMIGGSPAEATRALIKNLVELGVI